jgi:hypothetical protein
MFRVKTVVTHVAREVAPRARGGGHAGRAGARVGRKSSARARACRKPRPKCCPISRSEVDSLSAPGQDQLLRSGVGPLFWL